MPHSFGYKSQTRTLFKKRFRTNGRPHTQTLLTQYKRGDYVDIKVDSGVHKGMPFKHYHGRTGVVFNVNKRAVGVRVNKLVNGRIIKKDLHISVPHVRHSKCRDSVIARTKENEAHKKAVKAGSAAAKPLKRAAALPKAGYNYKITEEPTTIQPLPFVDLV